MNVLITGSNGFVGKTLSKYLNNKNIDTFSLTRKPSSCSQKNDILMEDFYSEEEWSKVLLNIDVVIHLIAKTHSKIDKEKDSLNSYRKVNVQITQALCNAIKNSSVKRLIFMSSIKVNGESTLPGSPFSETSQTKPEDNYGKTKLEAEECIKNSFNKTNKEYVILRPPLLYGKNLKGNLQFLAKLVEKGVPLPFASINNSRSILTLELLSHIVLKSLDADNLKNKIFLISNEKKYSLASLIEKVSEDISITPRIFYFPEKILRLLLTTIGKKDLSKKLFSNLEIDNSYMNKYMDLESKKYL
jgi:nucleoside-diphosphate-sugar epimerase